MVIPWFVFFALFFQQVFIPVIHGDEAETSKDSEIDVSEVHSSCSKGWFSFGDMCYRLGGKKTITRLSWEKAAQSCKEEYNGNLATVHSQELQDFLMAFLLMSARASVWIGMHDRENETDYVWDDGTSVNFTNWEPMEPSGPANEKEDCVHMVFRSGRSDGKSGQWNDIDCGHEMPYICQREKGKRSKNVLDPKFCSVKSGKGWHFESSCFILVNEKKTWTEAEEFCIEKYEGHLVKALDFPTNLFLNYVLRDVKEDLWIGIKIKEEFQQKWSSGWFVSFENWAEDEEEIAKGSCVFRHYDDGLWITSSCKKMCSFVCEYSSAIPPVLKPSIENSYCPTDPPGWRDLGGDLCYYFDTKNAVTWHKANFLCMRRGSTLLSIHSQEEVDVLKNFVLYTQYVIHIGLYRHMKYDEEFVWVDESPVDFIAWDSSEPNSKTELCVELRTKNMKWNDINCDDTRGYICSVPKIPPNGTIDQEEKLLCTGGFSIYALFGVMICVLFVAVLTGVVVYYFRLCDRGYERVKKLSGTKMQSPSELDKKPRYRSEIVVTEESCYENVI